jgi:hypothetical protein
VGWLAAARVPRTGSELLESPAAELKCALEDFGTPGARAEGMHCSEDVFGNVHPLEFLDALFERCWTGRWRT